MLNEKQIKAIEKLTGYKYSKRDSTKIFYCFMMGRWNFAISTLGAICVNQDDYDLSPETKKEIGLSQRRRSNGIYIFYTEWLAPLAKILEEK